VEKREDPSNLLKPEQDVPENMQRLFVKYQEISRVNAVKLQPERSFVEAHDICP
jgi:hypothetical protein